VKGLHFHDLRGEAGSRMVELGRPVHEVRDALGHASVTMTDTYLRARTSALDDAFDALHAAHGKVLPFKIFTKVFTPKSGPGRKSRKLA